MEGPPIENRSARHCPADQGEGLRRDRTVMGDEEEPVAVRTPNGRVVCVAKMRSGFDQRFQQRLQIEGRAAFLPAAAESPARYGNRRASGSRRGGIQDRPGRRECAQWRLRAGLVRPKYRASVLTDNA